MEQWPGAVLARSWSQCAQNWLSQQWLVKQQVEEWRFLGNGSVSPELYMSKRAEGEENGELDCAALWAEPKNMDFILKASNEKPVKS